MSGTTQEAAAAVAEKSNALGKTLSVWKLQGHTELDITVNLIQED